MSDVHTYIDENLDRFKSELFDFLRIPSVSARSEHKQDLLKAADWLADRMRDAGLDVRIETTAGHPIVRGDWHEAGSDAPTVLIYGHYDVQPAEPLDLWDSPPFEPEVRNGKLYARGACDDKGQLYVHVKALESHMKTAGSLPCNVIVLAEGEEEVGSENLMPYVREHADALSVDAIIISDTGMMARGTPTIGASLRGIAYWQLDVTGPATDLHSGSYGGGVINPATALARIIASFHDDDWRVTIPGFYDNVDEAADFRAKIKDLGYDENAFLEETGSPSLGGESGQSTAERLWVRPTCEVNGLLSGYTGEGAKTVLPAKAMAKISCRLVPDQDPKEIDELFRKHVESVTPEGVKVSITTIHGGAPWRGNLQGTLYEAAEQALKMAFDAEVVYAGEGGSIPIVPEFEDALKAPALLMGLGLPGENAHAPNEWFLVENFERGTHAAAELLLRFAQR
ncbi:MAG: dipeptidase [Gemmatimonadota bacterium]|jgi:acetylornithine deacetylase/succinyl-diaminopimelate desuccinylase-like protein